MRLVFSLTLAVLIAFSPATEAVSVEELAWMAGCWASVGAEVGSGEQWTQPAGGTLLGVNRTIKNSVTVAYEFLLIRESENGTIELVANPSGQSGAAFALKRMSENEVVFENPDHDFPQRIIYHLQGDDLEGRIEGEMEGEPRVVDFPMRRVDCESRIPMPEQH